MSDHFFELMTLTQVNLISLKTFDISVIWSLSWCEGWSQSAQKSKAMHLSVLPFFKSSNC